MSQVVRWLVIDDRGPRGQLSSGWETNLALARRHSKSRNMSQNQESAPNTVPAAQSQDGAQSTPSGTDGNPNANFPPPKSDKPRPHVCATCTRSFARLEHLKRHERSHTKEKPFECTDCTRRFARRDLLLRHQQKLHMTAMPASRQRGARRESTSSTTASGSVRVRKSSVANSAVGAAGGAGAGAMRPRANTISHVDNATLGMLAAANSSTRHEGGMSLNGLPGVGGYNFRGMSTAPGHHGNPHGLPKLETHGLNIDVGAGLRTAPPYGGLRGEIDLESLWFGPGSTVNPAQLHFSNSPQSLVFETPSSPYHHGFPPIPVAHATMDDDGNFTWLNGFENQLSFNNPNDQALDGSSPSVISTGSHSGLSDVMLDGANSSMHSSSVWPNSMMSNGPLTSGYAMDFSGSGFQDIYHTGQLSPKSLQAHMAKNEQYFSSPPAMNLQTSMSMMYGLNNPYFHPPMVAQPQTPSNSSSSVSSSNHQVEV